MCIHNQRGVPRSVLVVHQLIRGLLLLLVKSRRVPRVVTVRIFHHILLTTALKLITGIGTVALLVTDPGFGNASVILDAMEPIGATLSQQRVYGIIGGHVQLHRFVQIYLQTRQCYVECEITQLKQER